MNSPYARDWLPVPVLRFGVEMAVSTGVFFGLVWFIAQGNFFLLAMEAELPIAFVYGLYIVKYVAFFLDVGLYVWALATSAVKFAAELVAIWRKVGTEFQQRTDLSSAENDGSSSHSRRQPDCAWFLLAFDEGAADLDYRGAL